MTRKKKNQLSDFKMPSISAIKFLQRFQDEIKAMEARKAELKKIEQKISEIKKTSDDIEKRKNQFRKANPQLERNILELKAELNRLFDNENQNVKAMIKSLSGEVEGYISTVQKSCLNFQHARQITFWGSDNKVSRLDFNHAIESKNDKTSDSSEENRKKVKQLLELIDYLIFEHGESPLLKEYEKIYDLHISLEEINDLYNKGRSP